MRTFPSVFLPVCGETIMDRKAESETETERERGVNGRKEKRELGILDYKTDFII